MEDNIKYFPEGQLPNKEQIIKEKGIYVDPYFKNVNSSIYGKNYNNENHIKYEWTRIFSEEKIPLAKNEDNYMGFFSEDKGLDIKQGKLGNCYFIAYLHRLKEDYPGIFFSIFRDCKPNEGYFEVYFYKEEENGKLSRRIVFVDDYIPYKEFPSFCKPLFSHYNSDPHFNKFMVGQYLLIEKAYAKFKGCYFNIEGTVSDTAIFFDLTGVKHKIVYLSDFFESGLKKQIIEEKKLDEEAKNKIFNKIQNLLSENLVNAGTEDKSVYGQKNDYGIWANHRYDLLKCEKLNNSFFFHLWNPHGKNTKENKYKGFDNINKINKDGLTNGNITLDFDGFFLSFKRLIYQNKQHILTVYNQFECKGILDAFGMLPKEKLLFMYLFFFNLDYGLTLLLFSRYRNKGKDIQKIFQELMKETNNIKGMIKVLNGQQLWFYMMFLDKIKNVIIKESEKVMKKKSEDNLEETDIDIIMEILLDENEKSNDFFKMIKKINCDLLNNILTEIKKDIEPIARQIAEKYVEDRRRQKIEEIIERIRRFFKENQTAFLNLLENICLTIIRKLTEKKGKWIRCIGKILIILVFVSIYWQMI